MSNLSAEQMIAARTAIAIAAAAVGASIGVLAKRVNHRFLCGLVSFAAGALLSVTVLHIAPESIELAGLTRATASIILGLALFFILGKYLYFICPACSATAPEEEKGFLRLGILLIAALSIHSTMDGLAISAGMGTSELEVTAYLILLAVSYHKIPEGLALASVARLAGMSRLKAFGITILVEMTTAIGALLGIFVVSKASEIFIGSVLGFIGGSFLYIVGFATIKEMFEHEKWSIIGYTIAGFIVMTVFSNIFSHIVGNHH